MLKYFLYWLPMIFIAFGNAALREMLLAKHFSELRSQQFSTLTLILFCAIYTWFILPLLNIQSNKQAFILGGLWVVLTICFEFILGRVAGRSWQYLLQNYDIFSGRIWLLFVICLFFLPYLVFLLKNK